MPNKKIAHWLVAEAVGIGEEFAHRDGRDLRGCDRDQRHADGYEGSTHHVGSAFVFFNVSHAASCVAYHGVPVALVGECSIPVV